MFYGSFIKLTTDECTFEGFIWFTRIIPIVSMHLQSLSIRVEQSVDPD